MTTYRSPLVYRWPKLYNGTDLALPVPIPTAQAGGGLPFGQGAAANRELAVDFGDGNALAGHLSASWSTADPHHIEHTSPWQQATPQQAQRVMRWRWAGQQVQRALSTLWQQADPQQQATALPWSQYAVQAEHTAAAPFRQSTPRQSLKRLPWDAMTPADATLSAFFREAARRGATIALPWGPSSTGGTGIGIDWPVDPDPGDGGDPITTPTREWYAMLPTVSAVILPSRDPLELLSVRVATDLDAYCWSLTGTIPSAQVPLVTPIGRSEPVSIEVTINGYTWIVAVDAADDNRKFGLRTASIRGRSRSAELDAPAAPARSGVQAADRTIAQLADEQLSGTPWTCTWDSVDYLVPGGSWSYNDATALKALQQLADAVGAVIATDPTTYDLTVSPRYADSPWTWSSATPYAIIPASILTSTANAWQGGTNANGVYVVDGQGSGALVRIDGTGGEVQLSPIVERILTHADAQRERGRIELAKASKISTHQVTIPLFPGAAPPGLIPLGALLEISDPDGSYIGQCMAVQVSADRAGSALSVRQQLTLERHHRD